MVAGPVASPIVLRACIVVVSLALLAPVRPAAANAQEADPLLVSVATMSPWVDADHDFTLRLRMTNLGAEPIGNVLTTVTVFGRVITRSALRSALDGVQATGQVTSFSQGLGRPIEPGGRAAVALREQLGTVLTERGPYPLSITVTHSAGSSTLYTALPAFAPTDVEPVTVSFVLRADAPAVPYPFGGFTPEVLGELEVELLTQRLEVLARRIGIGVTFAPSPALVEVLARLEADGIETVQPALDALERAAAAVVEIASEPYALVDLPALRSAAPSELLRQIARGGSVIEQYLGRAPSTVTMIPPRGALDPASLDLLTDLGARAVIVDPALVDGTPAEPAHLEPDKFGALFSFALGDRGVASVLPDPDISERVASSAGVLGAQAILAETLGVWQELPLFASERIVLMAPARIPGPTMLAHLLDGLRSAPWVRMRPLSAAVQAAPPQGVPLPLVEATPSPRPYIEAALRARASLTTLTDISVEPPADLDDLERAVLLAQSDDWASAPLEGVALAGEVEARLSGITSALAVAERRVTLTSRTGDVPLTVVNNSGVNVRARVSLSSAKVRFPQGSTRSIDLAPGDNTFSFPVEVLATGAHPLEISVDTPDGTRQLVAGTVVIRSTAVSAVSLAVVAGSAMFLLVAWLRRARRRSARG